MSILHITLHITYWILCIRVQNVFISQTHDVRRKTKGPGRLPEEDNRERNHLYLVILQ